LPAGPKDGHHTNLRRGQALVVSIIVITASAINRPSARDRRRRDRLRNPTGHVDFWYFCREPGQFPRGLSSSLLNVNEHHEPNTTMQQRTIRHVSRFVAMDVVKKVKIGLDECRMQVLGVQVLIGFQLRSVFENAYDHLPTSSRYLGGLGLILLVTTLAL
jgi:hypothetical protein